jgi:hypothetical protein
MLPDSIWQKEIDLMNGLFTDRPNTNFNDFSFSEQTNAPAIILFYAGWSLPARQAKSALIQSLTDFPHLQVYILDVDLSATFRYMNEKDLLSHGWGETHWFKNGQIIASAKSYGSKEIHALINNHRML